jgi:hypothetical protein
MLLAQRRISALNSQIIKWKSYSEWTRKNTVLFSGHYLFNVTTTYTEKFGYVY